MITFESITDFSKLISGDYTNSYPTKLLWKCSCHYKFLNFLFYDLLNLIIPSQYSFAHTNCNFFPVIFILHISTSVSFDLYIKLGY